MKNHLETNMFGTVCGMEHHRIFAGPAPVSNFPIHVGYSIS